MKRITKQITSIILVLAISSSTFLTPIAQAKEDIPLENQTLVTTEATIIEDGLKITIDDGLYVMELIYNEDKTEIIEIYKNGILISEEELYVRAPENQKILLEPQMSTYAYIYAFTVESTAGQRFQGYAYLISFLITAFGIPSGWVAFIAEGIINSIGGVYDLFINVRFSERIYQNMQDRYDYLHSVTVFTNGSRSGHYEYYNRLPEPSWW